MTTGVDVVALGARTPVGLLAETSAAAVRARISGIREFPFVTEGGDSMYVAADRRLDPSLVGTDRLLPLARSVLDEVLVKLAQTVAYRGPLVLSLAMPELRPGLTEPEVRTVEMELAAHVRRHHPEAAVSTAGRGHAAVALAVEGAMTAMRGMNEALTVVVGVDSFIRPETFVWLESQRLFGPRARTGIIPGEAAGSFVLAPTRLRQRLGLPCVARISGVGTARERLLADSDTGSMGEGMTHALRKALAGQALPAGAADDLYADINGERYRSEEWGFVAMRLPAAFRSLEYSSPSECWGDVGAATGALGVVLAARAWARRYARGPRALVMTGSRNGDRGVIFLEEPST